MFDFMCDCDRRIVDTIATTQAPVILSQFAFSIITLSTLAFQATLVRVVGVFSFFCFMLRRFDGQSDDAAFLMYAVPASCILLELFIFCYYGNMLTQKASITTFFC